MRIGIWAKAAKPWVEQKQATVKTLTTSQQLVFGSKWLAKVFLLVFSILYGSSFFLLLHFVSRYKNLFCMVSRCGCDLWGCGLAVVVGWCNLGGQCAPPS